MREVVIDTETTGLSYKSGDRIIEVGCVELQNHIPTGNTLQFYCRPDRKISDGAKNIVVDVIIMNGNIPIDGNKIAVIT